MEKIRPRLAYFIAKKICTGLLDSQDDKTFQ